LAIGAFGASAVSETSWGNAGTEIGEIFGRENFIRKK
jgi:hypothetical protein